MPLITLYKPNGKEVKVNENSLDAAIALGWTDKAPKPATKKKQNKTK